MHFCPLHPNQAPQPWTLSFLRRDPRGPSRRGNVTTTTALSGDYQPPVGLRATNSTSPGRPSRRHDDRTGHRSSTPRTKASTGKINHTILHHTKGVLAPIMRHDTTAPCRDVYPFPVLSSFPPPHFVVRADVYMTPSYRSGFSFNFKSNVPPNTPMILATSVRRLQKILLPSLPSPDSRETSSEIWSDFSDYFVTENSSPEVQQWRLKDAFAKFLQMR